MKFNLATKLIARSKQKGVSLPSILLGFAILAGATVVIVNQFLSGDASNRVQKNIANVQTIIASAKTNYGNVAYSGLTTAVAVGTGIIPSSLTTNSTTAANEWGGAITLVDNSATVASTALLSWASVPSSDCVQIVNATKDLARQVKVAGTDVKGLDATLNIATLNTQCNSSGSVAVAWTIARS